MEILETEVEMPENASLASFKNPITGSQHPFLAVYRSLQGDSYKLLILFITNIHDEFNCTLDIEIKVLIHFRYSGPPLQPSDLFSLYWIASTAAKKKISENKILEFGIPIIYWQPFSLQILHNKLQIAIDKMKAKPN